MMRNRIATLAVMLGVLMLAVTATAEVTMVKSVNKTDAMVVMGQEQPAKVDTIEYWLSNDAVYMKAPEGGVLLKKEEATVYIISDENKSYYALPMAMFGATKEQLDAMPENPMAAMLGSPQLTVTPVDETKEVGDWSCKRYDATLTMNMGSAKMTYWSTTDAEIDMEAFYAVSSASMTMFPNYEDLVAEMEKIEGFPIETTTEMNMMGTTIKNSNSVIEITKGGAPDGIFDLPEGYTAQSMHPMLQGAGGQ